jgi:hypothetical protein
MVDYRNQAIYKVSDLYKLAKSKLNTGKQSTWAAPPKYHGISRENLAAYKYRLLVAKEQRMKFSFGSSDWMSVHYSIGAAQCLRDHFRQHILEDAIFTADSWSTLVAASLAMNISLVALRNLIIRISKLSASRFVSTLFTLSNPLLESLDLWDACLRWLKSS